MRAVAPIVAVALAALAGCGAPPPAAPELPKPVYSWSWSRGSCGGRHALDGEGTLWIQEGCDDGHAHLVRGPRASASQRAAIVEAFARLPEPDAPICSTPAQQFQIDAGGRVRTWDVCGVEDPAALTGPYAEVPRAFRGLGSR